MVANGPPIAAHNIMMRPGFVLTVFHKSPTWRFFAHTATDHTPLIRSLMPAAKAARANVTTKALNAACPSPHSRPANHDPQTPWVWASVRKPVYKP